MRIIHPYTNHRLGDQEETKQAISELTKHGFWVDDLLCTTPDSYWGWLMKYWGYGDLIIIEQDIVPHWDQIHQLVTCGFEACTVPYRVDGHWSVGNSIYDDVIAAGPTGNTGLGMLQPISTAWYETPIPRTVEVSGLGLVRLSKTLQERIPIVKYPVPGGHWSLIDTWLSAYMNVILGLSWHLHTPSVKHNNGNEDYYAQPSAEAQF